MTVAMKTQPTHDDHHVRFSPSLFASLYDIIQVRSFQASFGRKTLRNSWLYIGKGDKNITNMLTQYAYSFGNDFLAEFGELIFFGALLKKKTFVKH